MRRTLMLRSCSFVPRFARGVLAVLLVAAAGSAAAEVQIGLNFTGRVWSPPTAPDRSVAVPDTMGAVGEQHIVELLNDGYAVYRKSDGLLERSSTLTEFWVAAGVTSVVGQAFDPRVLYDAASQRWFAVSLDGWTDNDPNRLIEPNSYLVAVSNTADPTEGWTGFQIDSDPADTSWVDFPQIGMDAEGFYFGAIRNALGPAGNTPQLGHSLLVFPKADLLAATPSIANATNWPNLSLNQLGFTPQPVVNLDGGGLPATILSGNLASLGFLQSTKIGGSIGSPVLARSKFIAVTPTEGGTVPYSAAQPGAKADLYAGNGRFSEYAVQVDGSIWAAQTTRVDGRLAVRWYEIDAATDTLFQSGDVTDATLDLYFPSIAVNHFGQVVIGMSGSSETDYVGAYAAVGETFGGVTQFGTPLLLQAGLADFEQIDPEFEGRNRWGDFSATVVDPSDPRRFWTFQEYVEAEDIYGVRITELILAPDPQCSDGIDNDGDDLVDYPDDLGCDSPSDVSERAEPGSRYQCDDGIDNDGDGFIDYPDDPGCPFSYATIENPQCDDDIDNDGNGFTDFEDSKCQPSWPYWETPPCGLGAELALVLPLLSLAAGRRRSAN
jgi:hypothetical protein